MDPKRKQQARMVSPALKRGYLLSGLGSNPLSARQHFGKETEQVQPNPHNVGRNSPCPCGSGKKFKHCHLGKGVVVEGSGRPKDGLTKDGVPYNLG